MKIKNDPKQLFILGEAHLFGDGVKKSTRKAEKYFSMALPDLIFLSEEKDFYAQFMTAEIYFRSAKHRDLEKAHRYYELSYINSLNPVAKEMMEKASEMLNFPDYHKPKKGSLTLTIVLKVLLFIVMAPLNIIKFVIVGFIRVICIFFGFLAGLSGNFDSDSISSSFVDNSEKSGDDNFTHNDIGRGALVQEGMHRYIETSDGKTISIMDYDAYSGTAKDYDGNTYEVKGGGIEYR